MGKKKTNKDIFKAIFGKLPKFVYEIDLNEFIYNIFFKLDDVEILIESVAWEDMKLDNLLYLNEVEKTFNNLIITFDIQNNLIDNEFIPVVFKFEDLKKEFTKPVSLFALMKFINFIEEDYELAERIVASYDLMLFLKSLYTLKENKIWKDFTIALDNLPDFLEKNLDAIIKKFNEKEKMNIQIGKDNGLTFLKIGGQNE